MGNPQRRLQMSKIRDEKGNITIVTTRIQKIIRDYKNLYSNKLGYIQKK